MFNGLTFKGGVHPPDYKNLSSQCAIKTVPVPKQLSIMLSQHIGAICKPLVNKKDPVIAGQLIGNAEAFVSAGVHSPVNGTVKDIALCSHPVMGRRLFSNRPRTISQSSHVRQNLISHSTPLVSPRSKSSMPCETQVSSEWAVQVSPQT